MLTMSMKRSGVVWAFVATVWVIILLSCSFENGWGRNCLRNVVHWRCCRWLVVCQISIFANRWSSNDLCRNSWLFIRFYFVTLLCPEIDDNTMYRQFNHSFHLCNRGSAHRTTSMSMRQINFRDRIVVWEIQKGQQIEQWKSSCTCT